MSKSFRKYAATTMAAATAATALIPAAVSADTEKNFADVKPDNDHYDAIMALTEAGVIHGYSEDNTFQPWENVSRAQVAVMLYELLDLKAPKDIDSALKAYKDVDSNHVYAEQIAAVTEAEIFTGNPEGNFLPWDSITRQQMATVLVEGLELNSLDNSADVKIALNKVSPDHKANVQVLANLEITNQYGDKADNNFEGFSNITRGAFASMLHLANQVVEDSKGNGNGTPMPTPQAPKIESINATSDSEITVNFNEPVVVDHKNFEINNGMQISNVEISEDGKTVILKLTSDMVDGEKYTVTATDIKGTNGKVAKKLTTSFTYQVEDGNPGHDDSTGSVPAIESANAKSDSEVSVKFNESVDVDHTNFSMDNGMQISSVKVSQNGKTATLGLTSDMVDGETYTVTATDVKGTNGKTAEELTASFKYNLTSLDTVILTQTELDNGENIRNYVEVVDKNGLPVDGAHYKSLKFESTNTSVVNKNGEVVGNSGDVANVRVIAKYKDGTELRSSEYTIQVKALPSEGKMQGFFLEGKETPGLSSLYFEEDLKHEGDKYTTHNNTVAYLLDGQLGKEYKTGLTVGEKAYLHVFADDTDGNPMTKELNLGTNDSDVSDYFVESSEATVATATRDEHGVFLTADGPGTTTITVTKGDYTKSFDIEVKEAPKFEDVFVEATNLTISDESQNGDHEGVNVRTVDLGWADQYGEFTRVSLNPILGDVIDKKMVDGKMVQTGEISISDPFGFNEDDKLVISIDELKDGSYPVNLRVNKDKGLILKANKDKNVSNFDVKVTYHKADGSNIQKIINMEYNDVDPKEKAVSYEIAPNRAELNAGASKSYASDFDNTDFQAFALDAHGNRVADVTEHLELKPQTNDNWLKVENNTVAFEKDAYKYFTSTVDVPVDITVNYNGLNKEEITNDVYKTMNLGLTNTFTAPKSASIDTSNQLVDLSEKKDVSATSLIFGQLNTDNLVNDNGTFIGVKNGKDGYDVEPVITVKDKDGKDIVFGPDQYDTNAVGNNYGFVNDSGQDLKFDGKITNANNVKYNSKDITGEITVTDEDVDKKLEITKGDKATFTLVIDKVYTAEESVTKDDAPNLIDGPVQIQVTLVK